MCPMGGARLSGGVPRKGELMGDFVLPSTAGERVQLSEYRGRSNLVLVLAARQARELLQSLATHQQRLDEEQARVLAIIDGTANEALKLKTESALPFPVLIDPDRNIHSRMGALDPAGNPAPALYVTDRFGEVFAAFRRADGDKIPEADGVLDWLDFVNYQCEECFPPEWPAA